IASSILGHYGGNGVDIYSCSKGGLSILIKNLAFELAQDKIRINAISPGHVRTPLIRDLINDEKSLNEVVKLYPLGRIGEPEDITPFIIFLLSSYASWITGCDYIIDGGRSTTI
ncbi:MAG: SDR family oxidoreductase, partial [Deltaproteobacteria bacterium]|nr:SDR family oxidoreductase [Deltaproteobacteria bacterium]